MRKYTPLFGQIVESSLWREPLHVRVLFVTMLALKDPDHIVREEDHHLKFMANITDDEVIDGLKLLSEADKSTSLPQPFEGRRIERVPEGWMILNGEKYQDWMRRANLQAKRNRQKREKRIKDAVKAARRDLQDKADYQAREAATANLQTHGRVDGA